MAENSEADAVFEFRFHVDPGVPVSEVPKDLGQTLENTLKKADIGHLRGELVKNTKLVGQPKLVATSATPLTARIDIEFDPHSLADYSLADAQAKLNEVQQTIGEYLAYLLRLELDRMGFERSAQITFDRGFVHSFGLRWKEGGLSRFALPVGLAFAIGMICGAGILFVLQ